MSPDTFFAWFDGYIENMDGSPPSEKQWKRILEKLNELRRAPDGLAALQARPTPNPAVAQIMAAAGAAPPSPPMPDLKEASRRHAVVALLMQEDAPIGVIERAERGDIPPGPPDDVVKQIMSEQPDAS